jgi:hypothetical protein
MTVPDASGLAEEFSRIEEILQKIEQAPEGTAKGQSRALLQSVLRIHAAGLTAMLDLLAAQPGGSKAVLEAFTGHDLVSQLLLLHGLHPLDLETRVKNVLDQFHTTARVELLSVAEGVVRVRLEGVSDVVAEARRALEARLLTVAPDAAAIHIDAVALSPVAWRRGGPA